MILPLMDLFQSLYSTLNKNVCPGGFHGNSSLGEEFPFMEPVAQKMEPVAQKCADDDDSVLSAAKTAGSFQRRSQENSIGTSQKTLKKLENSSWKSGGSKVSKASGKNCSGKNSSVRKKKRKRIRGSRRNKRLEAIRKKPLPSIGTKTGRKARIHDPARWGIPKGAASLLAQNLMVIFHRFTRCFATKTRNAAANALTYLRGLLTMKNKRNYAEIARRVNGIDDDGQNIQHFMSDSNWDPWAVFKQIITELIAVPELSGGILNIDESGDPRSGCESAGTSRQYIGRTGNIEEGQVGVATSYYINGIWTMLMAELFMPEKWFDEEYRKKWQKLHIPKDREFTTKPKIALDLILKARDLGVPFKLVCFDELYGRNNNLRETLDKAGILYLGYVPNNTRIHLEKPELGPDGRVPRKKLQEGAVEAKSLLNHPLMTFQTLEIRYTERGLLEYDCAGHRIWTVDEKGNVRQEWLLIRREHDGSYSYALSNAPEDTSLKQLAVWKCNRYFAERTFQDMKSEIGWDELEARKYRSWMHHTAMSALALWFIAGIKLEWSGEHSRDPKLLKELKLKTLPLLSAANVREMLTAAMPLKQLTEEQSVELVVKHLVNRSRSKASREKTQRRKRDEGLR